MVSVRLKEKENFRFCVMGDISASMSVPVAVAGDDGEREGIIVCTLSLCLFEFCDFICLLIVVAVDMEAVSAPEAAGAENVVWPAAADDVGPPVDNSAVRDQARSFIPGNFSGDVLAWGKLVEKRKTGVPFVDKKKPKVEVICSRVRFRFHFWF